MLIERLKALYRMSAIRLASQLSLGFAVILLAGWALMLWFVERELMASIDRDLEIASTTAFEAYERGAPLAFGTDVVISVRPEDGDMLGARLPDRIWRHDGWRNDIPGKNELYDEHRWLIRSYPGVQVAAGRSIDHIDEVGEILNTGFVWMSGLGFLAIVALAGVAAFRTQKRIRHLDRGLARIAGGEFSTRLATGRKTDDLERVALSIDRTTARTEHLLAQIKTQSAHIAHDLRTPMARLRAGLEQELEVSENPSDAVRNAIDQIDGMIETFNALLRIASVESGARRASFKSIDLETFGKEVANIFEPVIEDAGQTLKFEARSGALILGDQELLMQLIGNLIQNALRYAPNGKVVTLIAGPDCLIIEDEGPGIAIEDRERVLEPLYKTDATRQSPGTGLGLAMVKAIADLHDAKLTLGERDDGKSGLAVCVKFG